MMFDCMNISTHVTSSYKLFVYTRKNKTTAIVSDKRLHSAVAVDGQCSVSVLAMTAVSCWRQSTLHITFTEIVVCFVW